MTKQQKTAAVIGGVILVLIIALFLRRRQQTIIQQGGGITLGGFSLPGIDMPPRGPPLVLPPFGINDANFSMIGACCADCSGAGPRTSYMPAASRFTYVYNEGNRGPNIFVYQPPPPPKQQSVAFFQR